MKRLTIAAIVIVLATAPAPAAGAAEERVDPVLTDLLMKAESSSPALARARASVAAGKAVVDSARTPYKPIIGVSERFTSSNNAPTAFALTLEQGRFTQSLIAEINDPPSVDDWATDLYVRYLLYDFGHRGAGMDAAKAEAEQWEYLEAATARDVRFRVSAAYYDLLRYRADIALWEDTVRLFRAHEDLTRAHYEAGKVLRSDLLSIGVRLGEAQENLISANNASHVGLVALAAAVGTSWRDLSIPQRELEAPSYDLDEETVYQAARDSHPALAAIDAGVRGAASAEKAESRGNRPSLSAEARGIWHGDDESFGIERSSYFAMVKLDIPLFDGGRSGAASRHAAARRQQMEASRQELLDDLELAARTAHRQAEDSVARISIADSGAEAAQEALFIVEERYRSGLARVVDLIEVQRALTEARVRALDARAQACKAIAAVERVAGQEVLR